MASQANKYWCRWFLVALIWCSRIGSAVSAQEVGTSGFAGPPATTLQQTNPEPQGSSQGSTATDSRLWSWDTPLPAEKDRFLYRDSHAKPDVDARIRGRIQADAIGVNQSEKDKAIIGNIQNAVGFRRARLGAEGNVGEQVAWVAEFDFATGNVAFKSIYVGVKDLPIVRRVFMGHMTEPFSLEGATSSNYIPFIERSPQYTLDPAFNWGVMIASYTEDERITVGAGLFWSGTDSNGNDIGDDNDRAIDLRVTAIPWYDKSDDHYRVLHLGAAFSQRFAKNDQVTYNQGAQSNLLQDDENATTPFQPKITIPASQNQLYNLETALVIGPFSFQAEYSASYVAQIGGGPVYLWGAYGLVSFFLTGEHLQYQTKDGEFGMTHVREPFMCLNGPKMFGSGPGAWEVLFRFAYLDFANANIPLASNGLRVGNKETQLVWGINWYLNDHARLMFDYAHVIPVDPNFGASYADAFFFQTAIFW